MVYLRNLLLVLPVTGTVKEKVEYLNLLCRGSSVSQETSAYCLEGTCKKTKYLVFTRDASGCCSESYEDALESVYATVQWYIQHDLSLQGAQQAISCVPLLKYIGTASLEEYLRGRKF